MAQSNRKLTNSVLYLLKGCPTRPGVTQLLKMLYYADYWHYRRHLSPITGETYVALERGPVLDDYRAKFERMETEQVFARERVPVEGQPLPKEEFVPKMDPDESVFTETELETLDEVIKICGHLTGLALSHRTHREAPWVFAWDPMNPGQKIHYMTFRWLDNLPDEDELKIAKQTVVEAGLTPRVRELAEAAA